MKLTATVLAIGLILTSPMPALAAGHDAVNQGQATEADWTEGTVRKINAEAGKVTLHHGPLAKLAMPAMTMVFRVRDPAWLNQMKPGDRIRFVVERVNGALTLTEFQPAR
jgi:Cu/Ag efflux protein CusF